MRVHDPDHLAYIRSLPCCIPGCDDNVTVEAAHLRFGSINYNKGYGAMGAKPHDGWTVPLCGRHHRLQHSMNEEEFWAMHGIDPFALAIRLRAP
jgi:hypothetical protein